MRALPAIGAILCCICCACETGHTHPNSVRLAEPARPLPVDGWPFRPTTISIHPLSYFPQPGAASPQAEISTVEIYVECLDQDEQSTRAPGVFNVEAKDPQSLAVSSFQADLSEPSQNLKYWDSVTRSYRFTIPIPAGFHCMNEQYLAIEAALNLGHGTVLRTSSRVSCPGSRP
jgi:hypothetical protein